MFLFIKNTIHKQKGKTRNKERAKVGLHRQSVRVLLATKWGRTGSVGIEYPEPGSGIKLVCFAYSLMGIPVFSETHSTKYGTAAKPSGNPLAQPRDEP